MTQIGRVYARSGLAKIGELFLVKESGGTVVIELVSGRTSAGSITASLCGVDVHSVWAG